MKTIYFLTILTIAAQSMGQIVTASWEPNPEVTVSGYRLLYGTNSAQYPFTNTMVGRLNTNVVLQSSNVPSGITYWAVQAYLTNGMTSRNSYEVLWTNTPPVVPIPPSAPRGFRLSANVQAGRTTTGPWTNLANLNIPIPPAISDQQFYRTRLLLEEVP